MSYMVFVIMALAVIIIILLTILLKLKNQCNAYENKLSGYNNLSEKLYKSERELTSLKKRIKKRLKYAEEAKEIAEIHSLKGKHNTYAQNIFCNCRYISFNPAVSPIYSSEPESSRIVCISRYGYVVSIFCLQNTIFLFTP